MTLNEAIRLTESSDWLISDAIAVSIKEIRRLWQMESQIQGHPLICVRSEDSIAERVRATLDEKVIEVQGLLESVAKRDKEIAQLREKIELFEHGASPLYGIPSG